MIKRRAIMPQVQMSFCPGESCGSPLVGCNLAQGIFIPCGPDCERHSVCKLRHIYPNYEALSECIDLPRWSPRYLYIFKEHSCTGCGTCLTEVSGTTSVLVAELAVPGLEQPVLTEEGLRTALFGPMEKSGCPRSRHLE